MNLTPSLPSTAHLGSDPFSHWSVVGPDPVRFLIETPVPRSVKVHSLPVPVSRPVPSLGVEGRIGSGVVENGSIVILLFPSETRVVSTISGFLGRYGVRPRGS